MAGLFIAIVIILVIISVFMLVILSYYNSRKIKSIRETETLKREFEQALLKTQLEVHEQTMRQISQEIHDNVGQVLSLVNLNLQTMNGNDKEKIAGTASLVNKAINDLRSLSRSLNPESLARTGLVQLIRNELHQLEKTGRFKAQLHAEADMDVPPDQLIILYRMFQEVLNNIIKHSGASAIEVAVTENKISVADNGKGFDQEQQAAGIGLLNLRQRAKVIGAAIQIDSFPGKGTNITFILNNNR